MNIESKKIIELYYFSYIFETEIYQQFRNLICDNDQLSFMKRSLIEKLENKEEI